MQREQETSGTPATVEATVELLASWPFPVKKLESLLNAKLGREDFKDKSGHSLFYRSDDGLTKQIVIMYGPADRHLFTSVEFNRDVVIARACLPLEKAKRDLLKLGWEHMSAARDYGQSHDRFSKGVNELLVEIVSTDEHPDWCVKAVTVGKGNQ